MMKYEHVESKILEFKEKLEDYSRLIQAVTAFLNTQGGTIIIGIRDIDREVKGLTYSEIEKYNIEIPQVIADSISPQAAVDYYEQNISGKICFVVRVFPGAQKPYYIKKNGYPAGVYLRFGSHNRPADDYAVKELARLKAGSRYENEPCPDLSYGDLSHELMGLIFTEQNENVFIGAGYGKSDVSGRVVPNVAGTLLFYEKHNLVVPESSLTVAQYAGRDKQNLIKTETFTGGLHRIIEVSFEYLGEIIGRNYRLSGAVKKTVDFDAPPEAVREALINAVAHKAYDYEAPVRITVFSNRIEFLNPGGFYAPIHSGNLRDGLSRYRNPLIADALRKTGHMEKQGTGIALIIDSCLKAGIREPEFLEPDNHLKLVIYTERTTNQSGAALYQYDTAEHVRYGFASGESFSSMELAQYLGKSQAMAKKILQKLRTEGVVEKFGSGPATRYRLKD